MKIFVLFSNDNIFKPRLLYQILLRRASSVCGVAAVGEKKSQKVSLKKFQRQINFWGVKAFSYLAIYKIFLQTLNLLPLPSFIKWYCNLKNVCHLFKTPYCFVRDVNDPHFIKQLRQIKPDIILSFQHQIFRQDLLSSARLACLNCHPAQLPKYRGVKPIFWAMLEQAPNIGVSVHTMTEAIDEGRLVYQETFKLDSQKSLLQNYVSAYEISASVILKALKIVEGTPLQSLSQLPQGQDYYCFPSKQQAKAFEKQNLKII